jgi:hypothetical protein
MKFKIFDSSLIDEIISLWNDEIASLGFLSLGQ